MKTQARFSLLSYLEKQAPVFLDGSMEPMLHHLGFPAHFPAFSANLTHQEWVEQVHQAYAQAGAEILRTNTAGAYPIVLEALGLGERIEALNNNGMALLRQALPFHTIAAGSLAGLEGAEEASLFLQENCSQQGIYLSDTGAQLFILHDFASIEEISLAAEGLKRVSYADVLGHVRIHAHTDLDTLLRKMEYALQGKVDFLGVQAGVSAVDWSRVVSQAIERIGIVSVLLDEEDDIGYGEISESFQQTATTLVRSEVALIGGGVNTTPAHIQYLKECWEGDHPALSRR